ncbi:MAG: signal peptidase II [Clostridia bacterium]|nr:signal peptidase II [Clostridia bacterium]
MSYILAIITGICILGLDQYTKFFITSNFELAQSYPFLRGLIDITYIHNRGGAWGMLTGHTWLLLSVTIVVMLICISLIIRFGIKNKLMFWAIIFILSGGLGNMIDRIFRSGNVIDFLHFEFFPEFPVFNVADCSIVLGASLLILYFVIDIIKDNRQKKSLISGKEVYEDENG